ncbi:hypothetical protein VHN57_10135 [Sphingobium sp. WW5]
MILRIIRQRLTIAAFGRRRAVFGHAASREALPNGAAAGFDWKAAQA